MTATAFAEALRPVEPGDGRYPPSPRGVYLRSYRDALGLYAGSVVRVLGIGESDLAGLETGRLTLDSATWARAELALAVAAGPGWCGELGHARLIAASAAIGRADGVVHVEASEWMAIATRHVDRAAVHQHQTIKRGALYCLAGWLAIEAGRPDEAVRLAHLGIVPDIGPMPKWLAEGLLDVIGVTVEVA